MGSVSDTVSIVTQLSDVTTKELIAVNEKHILNFYSETGGRNFPYGYSSYGYSSYSYSTVIHFRVCQNTG